MSHLRRIALGALVLVCLTGWAGAKKEELELQVLSPGPGAEVELETVIEGKVSDPRVQVYVLVHPVKDRFWWVQRVPAPPNRDGSWETLAYFGTSTKGIGEDFQVIALVTETKLKEGETFETLPSHSARSDVIKVKRAR
jgi:hypothetical protein